MPSYAIWLPISLSMDDTLLPGDAFRWDSLVWRVEQVAQDPDTKTVHVRLGPWPGEQPYPANVKGMSA